MDHPGGALGSAPGAPTIAHVDAERAFSGGEVQVFLLLEGLRRRGWRSVLFCPPGSAAEARARGLGFEVRAVRMRNELDLPAVVRLAGGFRSCGCHLVHLHTSRAHWLGGLAARLARVPALATRRMDRPIRSGMRTRLLYRCLVRHTAAISASVERHLLSGGVPPDRITRIHSAVDPLSLRARRSREATRAELGASGFVVLAAGALVRRKGHDLLLEALDLLGKEDLQPEVWIAGEGPERAQLELRAQRLRAPGRVRFLGRRDDLPDLLAACDALAMPSRAEGLGVAALEALAAGRAVLAARVGGLAELVQHERTGLLFEPEDPAGLARALARLIREPELAERLGRAGPTRVAEGYLADQMVQGYERLYREIAGSSAPASTVEGRGPRP